MHSHFLVKDNSRNNVEAVKENQSLSQSRSASSVGDERVRCMPRSAHQWNSLAYATFGSLSPAILLMI